MSDLSRVIEWLTGNDTGASSKAIAAHMTTGKCNGEYPSDPDDLGRCLRLLRLFPEWEARMPEMAAYGTAWLAMGPRWQEMARAMTEEVGIDWSKGNSARTTSDLMRGIEADGWRADRNYDCEFRDGRLIYARRRSCPHPPHPIHP